ncbi:hypothetical protein AKJ09_01169 [Labilithrix luteola]|uniref:Uncharacterized protein n=1 Tax=Labilithrix luteola TaxID=1391654 RepID=A0A0K1PLV5_9BACT|nr:hypothetical protein AKJ09_01169 [Labilithrix luteola]
MLACSAETLGSSRVVDEQDRVSSSTPILPAFMGLETTLSRVKRS